MRTVSIELSGTKRTLCFSMRVMRACTERYGTFSGLYKAISSEDEKLALDEALWVLAQMMQAGDRYAKENGLDNPPPLTVDELLDSTDFSDYVQLRGAITQTITEGSRAHVEVEPGKNGEATQEN